MAVLQLAGAFYVFVGVLHSIWLGLSVSIATCAGPTTGLVWMHCNLGMAVSHAATTLAWPLHWIGY